MSKIFVKIIKRCAECNHLEYITKSCNTTYFCRKSNRHIERDFLMPPDWCPLPDVEEENK